MSGSSSIAPTSNALRDEDPTELLRQAREAVKDGDLAIKIELIDGTRALNEHQDARAQQLFRTALDLATRQGSLYYQAVALNNSVDFE